MADLNKLQRRLAACLGARTALLRGDTLPAMRVLHEIEQDCRARLARGEAG